MTLKGYNFAFSKASRFIFLILNIRRGSPKPQEADKISAERTTVMDSMSAKLAAASSRSSSRPNQAVAFSATEFDCRSERMTVVASGDQSGASSS